jgi:tripartite-type tricarboxylate transporter receptor subunit TctC
MIVTTGTGSSPDILGRIVASRLSELWGQPVLVENIPGSGGNIGAERAAKSAPDGYSILLASFGPLYVNKTLYTRLGYDIERDFEPIMQISRQANILVVHPSVPARTVDELVTYGRANPGKLRFGSGGSGTSMHICAELFKNGAGIDAAHVPYKSSAQMMTELVAGQFEFAFHNAPVVLPQIRAGRLRALAVTSQARVPYAPELPTMAEAGFPEVMYDGGAGLVTPKGTPIAIVQKIYQDAARVLSTPAVRDLFAANGADPVGSTPAEFAMRIKSEIARWAPVIRASGAKLD